MGLKGGVEIRAGKGYKHMLTGRAHSSFWAWWIDWREGWRGWVWGVRLTKASLNDEWEVFALEKRILWRWLENGVREEWAIGRTKRNEEERGWTMWPSKHVTMCVPASLPRIPIPTVMFTFSHGIITFPSVFYCRLVQKQWYRKKWDNRFSGNNSWEWKRFDLWTIKKDENKHHTIQRQ